MKVISSLDLGTRRGPETWFRGTVWLDDVLSDGTPPRLRATRVSFEPGARTAWHTHPLGQLLHILSGVGWVQQRGDPRQVIRPGDSVWIEPGELHWHGAAGGRTMVHLAVQSVDQNGIDVVWLDHVTDAEYGSTHSV